MTSGTPLRYGLTSQEQRDIIMEVSGMWPAWCAVASPPRAARTASAFRHQAEPGSDNEQSRWAVSTFEGS